MAPRRQQLYEALDEALDLADRIQAPDEVIALLEAACDAIAERDPAALPYEFVFEDEPRT